MEISTTGVTVAAETQDYGDERAYDDTKYKHDKESKYEYSIDCVWTGYKFLFLCIWDAFIIIIFGRELDKDIIVNDGG